VWQETTTAELDLGYFSPEFWPAICEDTGSDRLREPWWYAVKFDAGRSRLLERLLKLVGLEYRMFVYEYHRPRQRSTTRSWLPGYFFVEFDVDDRWRQLHEMPGVIAVLGRIPTTGEGSIDDLVARCPVKVEPTGDGLESVPRGSQVRILRGTFADGELRAVTWSERKRLKVRVMAFNRAMEVELRTRDVEVVSV